LRVGLELGNSKCFSARRVLALRVGFFGLGNDPNMVCRC